MTLDDAIAKAKADGDVQLAEWLRQARGADAAARWYTEKLRDADRTIRKLLDENAKLRELVSGLEHCSQGFACNCCPLYDPSGTDHRRCESLERELGIEVDNGTE